MKIDRLIPEWKKVNDGSEYVKNVVSSHVEEKESVQPVLSNAEQEEVLPITDHFPVNMPFLASIDQKGIKVVFTPSKRKTTRRINVLIEGEFTVNTIDLIKERVPDIFDNYDYVNVSLKSIKQIDLSAIQLFYVLRTSYGSSNKKISVDAELSGEDKMMIHICGFDDLFLKNKFTE